MENTKCDWFLLIDDDAILFDTYLNNIEKHIEDGCLAYAGTVKVNREIDIRHRSRKNIGAVPLVEYDKDHFYCNIATFCGLLISRKLVDCIGYPRKDFFIWEDDTEYCYRFMRKSEILVVPSAILNHKTSNPSYKVGNTIKDDWKLYYGFRNKLVILKKYDKRKYLIMLLRLYIRAFQYKLKGFIDRGKSGEWQYNAYLRINAIKDANSERMGRNVKY